MEETQPMFKADALELRESVGLKVKELKRAQELAEERRDAILAAWHEHVD